MALTKGFIKGAATTELDTRRMFAGMVIEDSVGPRTGLLTSDPNVLTATSSTAPMRAALAKTAFVTARSAADGVAVWTNDGVFNVDFTAAPVANSRIDVVYAKHNDTLAGDANNLPIVAVAIGAAAATPVKPAIPSGAEEIGTVLIPAGATSLTSAGVVVTNTYRMTATVGGVVPFRTLADLALWTNADQSARAEVIADGNTAHIGQYARRGTVWVPRAGVKRHYIRMDNDGEYTNLQGIGTGTVIPATPYPKRIKIEAVGMIAFSGSPNASYGLNIVTTGGTLIDPQGNQQTRAAEVAQWYDYSHKAYLDVAANTEASVGISMSTPSTAGHWKGSLECIVLAPGEY